MRGGLRASRMDVRLVARHTGHGHAITCENARGLVTHYDAGDDAKSPSPMDHLLGAIAACSLMDIDIILKKKRLTYANLRAECHGVREERGEATPFVSLKLVFLVDGDVPAKAFDSAVKLSVEKYCSVGETLKDAPPIAWEARVG